MAKRFTFNDNDETPRQTGPRHAADYDENAYNQQEER